MNQNNLKINEKWTVLHGDHNNNPMIVRLNIGCKEIMGNKNFSHRMGIAIPFQNSQKDGLPNKKEKINLNSIENDIFKIFQKDNFSVICAIITTNNMIEFMIYLSDEDLAKERINKIGSKYPKYEFQYYIKEDKDWNGYQEFLTNE